MVFGHRISNLAADIYNLLCEFLGFNWEVIE